MFAEQLGSISSFHPDVLGSNPEFFLQVGWQNFFAMIRRCPSRAGRSSGNWFFWVFVVDSDYAAGNFDAVIKIGTKSPSKLNFL